MRALLLNEEAGRLGVIPKSTQASIRSTYKVVRPAMTDIYYTYI